MASVLNGAVNAGAGNGSDDGTYFVVSNGDDSRVYFWEGDTNPDPDSGSVPDQVDDTELTLLGNLEDFDDILSLGEENFQIPS